MKIYESSFDYDYSFSAVTLAYFLRYPNPYAKHVLSTDVIDRYVDPKTQRLHTLRLHLKKSKVPAGILKLLPRGLAGPSGSSQSYVLKKSTIDLKEGWMDTESKNMEWTGILSVVERQNYLRRRLSEPLPNLRDDGKESSPTKDFTTCKTTVTFVSRLGQAKLLNRKKPISTEALEEAETPKLGFFASLSAAGLQRTVELIGVKRTKTALVNGKEGMNVVLERLRKGGIVAVLEGMRRDRMDALGVEGPWKQVWLNGNGKERDVTDQDHD